MFQVSRECNASLPFPSLSLPSLPFTPLTLCCHHLISLRAVSFQNLRPPETYHQLLDSLQQLAISVDEVFSRVDAKVILRSFMMRMGGRCGLMNSLLLADHRRKVAPAVGPWKIGHGTGQRDAFSVLRSPLYLVPLGIIPCITTSAAPPPYYYYYYYYYFLF